MSERSRIETAPARGCYDRALSRQARQAEQRARLVGWVAEAYRVRGLSLTVQDVVHAAGVGRNTFYEYFDGLEHALDYAAQTHAKAMQERIVSALESARTPIAKLRALSRVWFDEIEKDPGRAALLLRPSEAARSVASNTFASLLEAALKQGRSITPANPEAPLIDYAAFAAAGGARALLTAGASRVELQEGLALLLTRVFR